MIAALYVAKGGCYFGLPDVDPWDEERDARLYAGPWPVVAHPPCDRWGRYYDGGPSWRARGLTPKVKGDDGGCFAAALQAVRNFGGVLEHPSGTSAWPAHGILSPLVYSWTAAGDWQGWVCRVDQGAFGHRARKETWLYAVGCDLPSLPWGVSRPPLDGTPRERKTGICQRLSRKQRAATPIPFRDLLLSMARSVRVPIMRNLYETDEELRQRIMGSESETNVR